MHVRQRKPNSWACPGESSSNSAVIVVSAATKLHTGTMTMTFSKVLPRYRRRWLTFFLGRLVAKTRRHALNNVHGRPHLPFVWRWSGRSGSKHRPIETLFSAILTGLEGRKSWHTRHFVSRISPATGTPRLVQVFQKSAAPKGQA